MGKDVRGIERGKCACGECEDFMRSDGATRGYCGCLPTHLFKKDARYSSDSVDGTSGAGTSESASPEEWKDEDLRRLPNPKANILNSQIMFCQNSGREPDDFQPRAQIKRLFEESELDNGDSEAIRKFSDKYIVPEKLVAEYVEHLAQIKMRKEKKKGETEREPMERLNREHSDIDWVGLYNSDKLSSLRVDELSLYFSHHKITFKGKKAAKVAMIKAHIGSLLYDSMECQQPRQPLLRNMQQQVTSSLSEVETDSQSDVVDRVVGSSPSSLSDELSPEIDLIPEPRAETLPPSKYGRKRTRVERDDYVS